MDWDCACSVHAFSLFILCRYGIILRKKVHFMQEKSISCIRIKWLVYQ